jgi:hypothetical protein
MGGESTSSLALVQSAGGVFRLTAQLMKEAVYRAGVNPTEALICPTKSHRDTPAVAFDFHCE